MWLAPGQHTVAVEVGNGVAVKFVASASIKLEITGQRQSIGAGLANRLATVALFNFTQLFGVLAYFERQAPHQPAPLGRAELAPSAVKCRMGGAHCCVNVLRIAALDMVENLAVRGVYDRNGLPRAGGACAVGDVIEFHGPYFHSKTGPGTFRRGARPGFLASCCSVTNEAARLRRLRPALCRGCPFQQRRPGWRSASRPTRCCGVAADESPLACKPSGA